MRLAAAVAALVLVCSAGAAGSVPSASPSILPAATSGEPPSAAPTETLAAPTPFAIGLCHPGEVAIGPPEATAGPAGPGRPLAWGVSSK